METVFIVIQNQINFVLLVCYKLYSYSPLNLACYFFLKAVFDQILFGVDFKENTEVNIVFALLSETSSRLPGKTRQ